MKKVSFIFKFKIIFKKDCFIGSMLKRMLALNYEERSTIDEAFCSPFCKNQDNKQINFQNEF